tara:strand:+ start:8810 stop:9010 length:201 start_codon:yes stop_codon:yes gene_type:complete
VKVGDLVIRDRSHMDKANFFYNAWIRTGLVIAKGVFVGNKDIKVLWSDGEITTAKSKKMEVINESR